MEYTGANRGGWLSIELAALNSGTCIVSRATQPVADTAICGQLRILTTEHGGRQVCSAPLTAEGIRLSSLFESLAPSSSQVVLLAKQM